MKVVVSGGGTGGHILPVLAVIKSLNKIDPDLKIIFIGSRFGVESQLIPRIGVKYYGIEAGKFRRYHKSHFFNVIDPTTFLKNINDFFKFIKGFFEAKKILNYEKPDVIFAKGGFVSLPVGLAAFFLKIPLIIHESDSVMGLANKIMAKFAARVCVTFPKHYYPESLTEKILVTGNPTREDLKSNGGANFKKLINFSPERKTILVLGGSQGSQFINDAILEILDELLINSQLIWVTGEKNLSFIKQRIDKLSLEKKKHVKVFGFITTELADVYDASDLVVSRAGSNVIFELAMLEKPSILIPLEGVAGDHQLENAKYFSRKGAAFLINQKELSGKKLYRSIRHLLENPNELAELSRNIKRLFEPQAADLVAKEIYNLGAKRIEQTRKIKQKK